MAKSVEISKRKNLVNSIAFLLESTGERGISEEDMAQILTPPLQMGQSVDGRLMFTSIADQCEIYANPKRIDTRDLSSGEPGGKPLAQMASDMISLLKAKPRAVGLNYEIFVPVVGETTAAGLIAAVFDLGSKITVAPVDGAAITLYYKSGVATCTLRIEPKGGKASADAIYVNQNVHHQLSDLAAADADEFILPDKLQQRLIDEYEELLKLLENVLT